MSKRRMSKPRWISFPGEGEKMNKRRWGIKILWAHKDLETLYVYGRDGIRRPAEFNTKTAAMECQYVINKLMTASTYDGTTVFRLTDEI